MAIPVRQLLSQTSYNANGSDTVWDFSFAGGYLDQLHVKASKLVKATGVITQIPLVAGNFVGPFQLSITPALPVGTELTIYRNTPKDVPLVNFVDKAALTEASLDLNAKQAIFTAAESSDGLATAIDSVAQIASYTDAALLSKNASAVSASAASSSETAALASKNAAAVSATAAAGSATNLSAAVTAASGSATAAAGSATAASGSATASSSSATAASGSATAASGSAGTASTQAGNAAGSATSASGSATAANTAKLAAELALDSFDDRYLGNKAAAPTLDNDGMALLVGALYWDNSLGLRGYNGTSWVTIPAATAVSVGNTPAGNIASTNVQAALNELDAEKQIALGFVPIQQGGGAGQLTNVIRIGWSGNSLKAQVDGTDLGNIIVSKGATGIGSLVGAVSQVAGVPTGAVIERGSNANGEYVRFADGTQRCWGMHAAQAFPLNVGVPANVLLTLPATFVAAGMAAVIGFGRSTLASVGETGVYSISTTQVGVYKTGSAGVDQGDVVVMGRWF